MCKAIASARFGPYAYPREKEDFVLLGDFRLHPMDQLEVYRPSHTKPALKPPGAISEFQEMSTQQALLIEAVSGKENGDGRRRAIDFFVDLHRDAPDNYTIDFTVDVRERMSIDYMEIARGGIRRMEPYLEAQAAKVGLRKVSLSPMYTKSG